MHDWASHQAADASAYAIERAPRAYRVAAIYAAVTPWARANPREALAKVQASTALAGQYRAAALIALVRGWYDSGQPGLEQYVRDLGPGFQRLRALPAYVIALIRERGVDAAVQWAEAVPESDPAYQREVYRAVTAALVPFDVAAAKRFCETHCKGDDDADLVSQIALLGTPADAPAASPPSASGTDLSYQSLVELIGNPDDFAKASRLGTLLPKLGPESLPAVKRVLSEEHVLDMGAVEYELLMRYWSNHDPGGAGLHALSASPLGYRVVVIYVAVPPWVRAEPQRALEFSKLFSMQGGDYSAAAQIALVLGWYDSGRPGLEDYIHDLGAGFERQRALRTYATSVIRTRGADAVIEWAESVPEDEPDYKLEVIRAVGPALVPFDLAAAKRFCKAHCDGPHGSNLRSRIATRWVREGATTEPLEWLHGSPKGRETEFAVRLAFEAWGGMDREGALRWMKQQTASGEAPAWLRPALPMYARLLAVDSPAEGLAWAGRLETEKERDVVTLEIAHAWRLKDEPAAEAWLRQSSLPPELQEIVRSPEPPLIRGKERPYRRAGAG
jgi:hypothetical protein